MAIHAFGAIAIAEMRSSVRLVRTQFFVALALAVGLGIYAAQAVFHRILWASPHLVTPPRFLMDTIGTAVLTVLAVGTVALAFDHRVRDRNERIAEAGIPEYWIVDPRDETITVLALEGDAYRDIGVFGHGDTAESRVLDGFAADVRSVFDAPKPHA